MSHLTTHVLETATGKPAAGVVVTLHRLREGSATLQLADEVTDADGRIDFRSRELDPGRHALRFATGAFYERQGIECFFPLVTLTFALAREPHYHVPLLLSPFAYSTYRGS